MATELFVNTPHQAVSLNGAIATAPVAGTVETWAVTIAGVSGTQFALPTIGTGQMRMVIETEIVLITAGTTTTGNQSWTVTRGVDSTTPTTHSTGSALVAKVTAAALALPNAHASSHDVGGSDVLKDLTRLAAGPAMHKHIAWNYDVLQATNVHTPGAGIVYLDKILTAHAYTISVIDYYIRTGGTGVTSLANCFIGIYDSGGTRRFVSADQSSAWATSGAKSLSLGGSAYTVTANDFIYIAILIGTQSTTALQLTNASSQAAVALNNINLAAAESRNAQGASSGLTAIPTSLTLSTNSAGVANHWYGVR